MDVAFRRIAVVNRGEAAMRLINAVREMRFEHGVDVSTIALYTDVERTAMFVREADEAICIDLDRPADAGSPYLDLTVLEHALVRTNADAAWVGWGFVAERPEFAELCDRLGVAFIGPRPEVMRRLGDKIEAKLLAEQADVPVAPWSGGPVETIEAAREQAARIGYPLMVKATAGGGGRGIRKVTEEAGLADAFTSARAEGLKAFGDATVFMERVVGNARHVEVQLIGDTHGTVWAVGVRDCSMQRRNQKVIEESHCVALTAEQDRDLRAAAVRLAQAADYQNAGTVEFLYQPAEQVFSFLEVNTRLQVEHPVTELTTGLDLVKLQIHVASGGTLEGDPPPTEGYAIEARLNAEDPQRAFAPAPGVVETLSLPVGSGIRVDTGVAEGDVIPPEFDSMIAKIIAVGRTRDEALGRLHRALSQMTVLVRGGTTNKSFLLDLLERPEVRAGDIDTSWLDALTTAGEHLPTRLADVALVAASLDAAELLWKLDRETFWSTASRGRSEADSAIGQQVELRSAGETYKVCVRQVSARQYEIVLDELTATVEVTRLGRWRSRLTFGETSHSVVSSTQDNEHLVEVDGIAHRFSRDDAGVVRAPSASLVVRVDVSVDDVVAAGDQLAVVEAMKMEIAVHAPIGGRVRDVFAVASAQVVAGAPLVQIEPETDVDAAPDGRERIVLDGLAGGQGIVGADLVLACVLGFDVDDSRALALVEAGSVDEADVQSGAILDAFADVVALAPERLDDNSDGRGGAREYFNSYLRSCDIEREGLPAWFGERLLRAVGHYGVSGLEPTDALRDTLYRVFLARQRRDEHEEIVAALLRDPGARPELRGTLDHLIDATRRRAPAIAALSRSVRHRLFDLPHIERARAEIFSTMQELATTVATTDGRSDDIDRLVGCSLPLMPIYAADDLLARAESPGRLIGILTRRFYRIRDLSDVRVEVSDGLEVVRTAYPHKGRTVHVVAFRAVRTGVADAIASILDLLGPIAAPDTVVMDVYVPLAGGSTFDTDAFASEMDTMLRAVDLPEAVRRVCFASSQADRAGEFVTFRRADASGVRPYWMVSQAASSGASSNTSPTSAGEPTSAEPILFEEDIKFRGIHPMIARRLQMWRLANFEISPLPAEGEAHLFDCVARDNPSDRRLVAVAEVRDITPVRDANGRVVALPEVEHVLVGCLDAIRRARATLPGAASLEWNRIMLYVWPPVDFSPDELDDVAHRLAPLTEGLGLEQVVVSGRLAELQADGTPGDETVDAVLRIGYEPGRGVTVRITEPATEPMQPLDDYTRKLMQTRRRGLTYPYEIVPMLAGPNGSWVEYDLDQPGTVDRLVPVERPPGENTAGIIVGVASTPTTTYPEGIIRVTVLGDPTMAMGSITEAECRRLLAAIDLAHSMGAPIEWLALSAGAKIAMDSGSENLDWVARVLRRIVEHTQEGGEINVVVAGVNVGAQPYWNAESTMLMHTKGILVMTPDSSMVLTGKQAIDYSGGVSAEDNFGIGGYERIMGPNGEAQYWAPSVAAACDLLLRHYDLTYRAPGEPWPRRVDTVDPIRRDVRTAPHVIDGVDFTSVGDIFSHEKNPDRKKPFDIRALMAAVADTDTVALERWPEMAEAEMAVVHDCRLGGLAVTMIGMESRPLPRHGVTPADGPTQWSAGTLFPLSAKKVARSINAASGSRPVVMLANLSGFDGSPESLRRLQLEYGAEIGRAIVNFDGPFVLCVVSRYHGGAFVVFSATLNEQMEVLAVEGSFASVIGGAPAAAVVFNRDVDARMRADHRVQTMDDRIAAAQRTGAGDEGRLRAELLTIRQVVRTEKMGEVAAEFDAVHSVERARSVGSVHRIIEAADLRAELIASVERGMERNRRPTP